ncbi:Peptidase family S41 [compost metagenome]
MSVYWTEEGPVILNSTLNLQRGDLLISLGGLNSQELLGELKKVISAENEEWVKMRGSGVMITDSFLKHLNLVNEDNTVEISVKRNGEVMSFNLPFNKKNVQESLNTPFDTGNCNYSYTINEDLSLGILQINACIFDEEYKNTLQNFFAEVNQLKIDHVAVDLRNNTGGDSRVIDEFLRYVNVDKFTTFSGLVRFSLQAKELRNGDLSSGSKRFPSAEMKNTDQVSPAFSGKLYALTSAKTFSSGNMFAVMLQDNKIGTIIGESTGNQPSAYGDILDFSLPHSQFQFTLSYKQFFRPNEQLNDQLTLEPDIPVYTTRQDIIDGRDAQLSKLEEMIKTEQ